MNETKLLQIISSLIEANKLMMVVFQMKAGYPESCTALADTMRESEELLKMLIEEYRGKKD